MFNRAALFATSVAGMAACGAVLLAGPRDASAAPQGVSAVEVAAPAVGWHLVHEGDRAKLAFGAERSDHILFMLSCAQGEEAVEVFGLADPRAPGVTLASADARTALDAEPKPDPMTGALMVETRVRLDAPALDSFRRTGGLALSGASERPMSLDARGEEQASVEAFFAHCSGQSA